MYPLLPPLTQCHEDASRERSIRDIWWKEGSLRAAFWLVFPLLCTCVGWAGVSGEREGQVSGKTGELWREMKGWGSCPQGRTLERGYNRGEFRGSCSTKGRYNHPLHLPRQTSLKSPLCIHAFWHSIVFSGDLHIGIQTERAGVGQGDLSAFKWQKLLDWEEEVLKWDRNVEQVLTLVLNCLKEFKKYFKDFIFTAACGLQWNSRGGRDFLYFFSLHTTHSPTPYQHHSPEWFIYIFFFFAQRWTYIDSS